MTLLENAQNKTVLVATGASGGHVFPALAVAEQLQKKGFSCVFVGNKGKFLELVEQQGYTVEYLPASPWNVANPFKKLKAVCCLVKAFSKALKLVHRYKASAVFGTGGYATVALILASKFLGVPTLIAEQNVLPGRANRFLSRWADKVCLTFESSRHYLKYRDGVMVTCGNPIRESIVKKAASFTKGQVQGKTLVIMGGSQGAKILSDIVPAAVDLLSYELKRDLKVIQQTRPEDEMRVKMAYHDLDINAEVRCFFDDMPSVLMQADVLIARSGASTICEALLFGVPAVYVPLKLADGHQILNAKSMENKGCALSIDQHEFTPVKLAEVLTDLLTDETRLEQMSSIAKEESKPDAALSVASEVIKLSEQDLMQFVGFEEKKAQEGSSVKEGKDT